MKYILKIGLMACLATAFVFASCKKDDNNKYTITLSANNPEMGVVAGAGEYDEGAEIQIMATANNGYQFVKWSDEDTNNPRTITVNKNIALIAVFAERNNGGTVNGGGNNNSENTGTATGDILPNKITKIVRTRESSNGGTQTKTYLFDSEGRIKSYKRDDDTSSSTYDYSDNSIKYKEGGGNTEVFSIENGRITEKNVGGYIVECGYSPDGYLASHGNEKYIYEKGLLTKITYWESDGRSEKYNWESKITYGTTPNNLSVDLMLFFIDDDMTFSGLFGNRVKLLPTLIEEIDYFTKDGVRGEEEYEKSEFTYEYSGEYITKIIVKETDDDGEVYNYTYEIFY
ncbi:MAG: hypothetical protein IKP62_07845 [Salinivirgaceae bacterium]|nr:hypothetical protein [Salinivirgaceae bacterium]